MSTQEIRTELALHLGVQSQLDKIVRAANRTASLFEGTSLGKNAIRNVLNVADESRSVEVVSNFIRYQIGRSGTGQDWQRNGVGLQIIKDIESDDGALHQATGGAVHRTREEMEKRGAETFDEARVRQKARRELTQLYLGFLNRAFYYGTETKRWTELAEAGKEE